MQHGHAYIQVTTRWCVYLAPPWCAVPPASRCPTALDAHYCSWTCSDHVAPTSHSHSTQVGLLLHVPYVVMQVGVGTVVPRCSNASSYTHTIAVRPALASAAVQGLSQAARLQGGRHQLHGRGGRRWRHRRCAIPSRVCQEPAQVSSQGRRWSRMIARYNCQV